MKNQNDEMANIFDCLKKTIPLVKVKAIEQWPHGKEWPLPGIPTFRTGLYSQLPLNCIISLGLGRPVWSFSITFTNNTEATNGVNPQINKFLFKPDHLIFVLKKKT